MSTLAFFFGGHMVFVYFIYGLAFFGMGIAIALESKRSSELRLANSMWLLSVFALLHGFVEWSDMFLLIQSQAMADSPSPVLQIARVIVLALSAAFLIQFGAKLLTETLQKHYWLQWLPYLLFIIWGGSYAVAMNWQPAATLEWLNNADVWARYLLLLPGSVLAGLALFYQGPVFRRIKLPYVAADCQLAAIAFGANAVIAGMIVPRAPYFPASILNSDIFITHLGVPVQLFRAFSAIAIAYFIIRVLRIFEIQYRRQLALADQQRFDAQQEALEAQRKAQQEIEEWNKQLEARVQQRTSEIEQRNRELSAFNAISATLSQSLDLDRILNDTLDKVLELTGIETGGIFILDEAVGELFLKAHRGASEEFITQVDRVKLGEALTGRVAQSGEPIVVQNQSQDIRADQKVRKVIQKERLRAFACIPLKSKGKVVGVMNVGSHHDRSFSLHDVELLMAVGHQVGVAIENAKLFQETQRGEREAETLYEVGTEISGLLDIDQILDSVVQKARTLLGTEMSALSLLDGESGEVFMKATSGVYTDRFKQLRLKMGDGLGGKVVATGESVMVEDYVADKGITHPADSVVIEEGLRSFLVVPLRMGENVFGAFYVANRTPQRFFSRDVNLLCRLANQAAIAIENAQLYDQVQNLAVLEERDRIAREMHDGLAQVLGYLNLKTKTVQSMLPRGKIEQAQVELVDMEKVIQDAYADVRESIFGLRTSVASTLEFLPTLAEYCQKFSQQSNLPTTLDPDGLVDMRLSPTAEVQLVRIIQEALANVRKHAKATSACVRFQPCEGMVSIVVEDNGQGFDLLEAGRREGQHFGLQTMRERAESVGGTLDIDSKPGKGTSVIVKLPVEGEGG